MELRKPLLAATLAAGILVSPIAFEAPSAQAEAARTCVDVNGGTIGPEDNLPVKDIQKAVGAIQDGKFGAATCNAVWNTLISEGHLTGNGTTLKVGDKVVGLLNLRQTPITAPLKTPENPTPTTDKTCAYSVISSKETGNLLGAVGKSAKELCSMVVLFQKNNELATDGNVGPATAKKIIKQSDNACAVYGGGKDDCFLGMQENGNLGTLYTIKDGDITRTMQARFGNPNRSGGKATPEGQFAIFRSIEGPHAGSNCAKVGDVVQTCMENPIYFNGGMAIHGTSKPQSEAGSLGCIGVSNQNSDLIFEDYKAGNKTVVMIDFQRNQK